MCGIVGYVGDKECTPILIEGLRRLEYRGYDSAGMAVLDPAKEGLNSRVVRCRGKLSNLENLLRDSKPQGASASATRAGPRTAGPATRTRIRTSRAACRWCTTASSRTIRCCATALRQKGRTFSSETDTEIIAHLVDEELKVDGKVTLREAVRRALKQVQGAYAIVVHGRLAARHDRRRQERLAAGARARRRRELRRLRRAGDPRAHAQGDVPRGGRDRRGEARPASTIIDLEGKHASSARPRRSPGARCRRRRPATSTSCSRRSTSRRARSPTRCAGGSRSSTTTRSSTGIELDVGEPQEGHDHRLRHLVARGARRQVPDRAAGAHSRSRSTWRRSIATAIRSSARATWSSPSRSRARPPTRWRR